MPYLGTFSTQNGTFQHDDIGLWKCQGITKDINVYPLETMDICTNIQRKLSDNCYTISVWTKVICGLTHFFLWSHSIQKYLSNPVFLSIGPLWRYIYLYYGDIYILATLPIMQRNSSLFFQSSIW